MDFLGSFLGGMSGGAVGSIVVSIVADSTGLKGGLEDAKKSASGFADAILSGKGLSGALGAITTAGAVGALVALGTALIAVADAAMKAADAFNQAMNAIYIGTGATGAALDSLDASLMNISGTVGNSTDDIAAALGNLNTAYDLTDAELEGLSKTYLALAKVTGGDVSSSIEKSREVWNKWGVTVEDQSSKLDYFFRISQQSGAKMDTLLSILAESDRGFQLMGLSVEEAAAMIGTLTKTDGVAAAREFASGIEMAAVRMAEEYGSDSEAQQALGSLIGEMKAAGDEQAAMKVGADVFGKSIGTVAGAIYGGALEFKGLQKSASEAGPSLVEIAKQTESLEDKMTKLGAAGQEALRPIGDVLLGGIGNMVDDNLIPMLDVIGKIVQVVVDFGTWLWEHSLLGIIQTIMDKLKSSERIQAAIQRIVDVFGRLWERIVGTGEGLDLLDVAIDGLVFIIENLLVPALDLIAIALAILTGDWEYAFGMMTQFTKDATESEKNLFGDMFDEISGMFTESIKSWITTVSNFGKTVVNTAVNAIAGGIDAVDQGLDMLLSAFEAFGQSIVDYFVDMWNGLIGVFERGFQTLLDNTPLGSILGLLGVDTTVDLSRYQISAPEITLPRTELLKDASQAVRQTGVTINQQINVTTNNTVSALDIQRATEKASRDAMRAGI